MIIIKLKKDLKSKEYQQLYKALNIELENGLIVLPNYCSLEYIDNSNEIHIIESEELDEDEISESEF